MYTDKTLNILADIISGELIIKFGKDEQLSGVKVEDKYFT